MSTHTTTQSAPESPNSPVIETRRGWRITAPRRLWQHGSTERWEAVAILTASAGAALAERFELSGRGGYPDQALADLRATIDTFDEAYPELGQADGGAR